MSKRGHYMKPTPTMPLSENPSFCDHRFAWPLSLIPKKKMSFSQAQCQQLKKLVCTGNHLQMFVFSASSFYAWCRCMRVVLLLQLLFPLMFPQGFFSAKVRHVQNSHPNLRWYQHPTSDMAFRTPDTPGFELPFSKHSPYPLISLKPCTITKLQHGKSPCILISD